MSSNKNTTSSSDEGSSWTFFTNHAHVLIVLFRDPDLTLREVAEKVGITERAVQRIVHDLEEESYLTKERVGRKNHYILSTKVPLRHPVESHCQLRDIIDVVVAND